MTKTLYLHGLDSALSAEKRKILEQHTSVISPAIDYRSSPEIYHELLKTARSEKVDCVIGSSMGGCMAYFISLQLNVPTLVFNPALPYRSVYVYLPENNPERKKYLRVILGGQDDIIDPRKNLDLLTEFEKGDMDILWRNTLGHSIPADVFEEEVNIFFTGKMKYSNVG